MGKAFDLILITSEMWRADEMEIICRLFNLGLETLHVRKPDSSLDEMRYFLEILPKEFHNKVVLHSHFPLADEFKVKGIHLNENNKKLIAQLGGYHLVSASFHSLDDLGANKFPYRYVFLGPVFDSISKPGHKSKFALKLLADGLEIAQQQNPVLPKVVALGGINAENVVLAKRTGFSGAALLGAVWESGNPVQAFLEIQALVRSQG